MKIDNYFFINREWITIETINDIISKKQKLILSEKTKDLVLKCRNYLDNRLESNQDPIYGINTGFGSLCDTKISKKDLEILQTNLVISHACGLGDEIPQNIVKLILFLKIQSLSYGYSGIKLETLERLIWFYNNDVLPVIYEQGSLGASGDLAPLAHLALALIGKGEVNYDGNKISSMEFHQTKNLEPIKLGSKEGLALLNGTQFMCAYGIDSILRMKRLNKIGDIVAAISLDAFKGRISSFSNSIHQIRPHNGQLTTAKNIQKLLEGSEIMGETKTHVQDPYSFRCIPQVHGACKDVIDYVGSIFDKEINSVTDNPIIFPERDEIISGGNFHGEPLAMSLDYLGIAISELGSISERRIYKLISGERGLPAFLVANPGLNSGFMIPQYVAASIVSQNKQLAAPCSVDTIDSSNGQEDHVSMGANAALKVYKIINNLEKIVAIELMNAVQALEFRRPLKTSYFLEEFIIEYRKVVPFLKNDVEMHPLIEESRKFINNYNLIK